MANGALSETGLPCLHFRARRLTDSNNALPIAQTPPDIEVTRHLTVGTSDREIGDALLISRATVARHVANSRLQLDVSSGATAAVHLFRRGLV